jgi:hypothetical protein
MVLDVEEFERNLSLRIAPQGQYRAERATPVTSVRSEVHGLGSGDTRVGSEVLGGRGSPSTLWPAFALIPPIPLSLRNGPLGPLATIGRNRPAGIVAFAESPPRIAADKSTISAGRQQLSASSFALSARWHGSSPFSNQRVPPTSRAPLGNHVIEPCHLGTPPWSFISPDSKFPIFNNLGQPLIEPDWHAFCKSPIRWRRP